MFFITASLFTLLAVVQVVVLRNIHSHYRRSGASIEGAKNEFAQEGIRGVAGAMSQNNPNIGQV